MGVPKFYRWLSERYPLINRKVGKDVRFLPEFDNFYLDMNGIIHNCTHPNDDQISETLTMKEMVLGMFTLVDRMVQVVRPQKVLFLAVDGCAPRAKMNQQRSRRFASARDRQEALEKAIAEGTITAEDASGHFDSNCITPGTEFMAEVSIHFQYFIRKKIKEDPVWRRLKVIYSGHDVPGEGEHKIMDYIRHERLQPGYDPNTRHCCNSLDADLIMLGLATHEPHFSLLREEVDFSGGRNKKGGATTKEVKRQIDREAWELLDLNMLRQYLDLEFRNELMPFMYDVEAIIDDWVTLIMIVGNDFLPHMPSIDIGEGAIDEIMRSYRELLPTMGGYITEGGKINPSRIEKIFKRLGEREYEVFSSRKKSKSRGRAGRNTPTPPKTGSQNQESALDFKRKYYAEKLGVDIDNEEEFMLVKKACESFMQGLVWCFDYYYYGVPSWTWFYPFHYAPMASDMIKLSSMNVQMQKGEPFHPFTQLLCCLPPQSSNFLPKCYRELMTLNNSPVIEYYPLQFEIDMNGKRNPWEAVNLVPFIDSEKIQHAIRSHCPESKLSDKEKNRNKFGREYLYQYDPSNTSNIPSSFPAAGFEEVLCCESSVTVYNLPPVTRAPVRLLKGAEAFGRWPGDPQVHILNLKRSNCRLEEININVFGRPSRKESFVISVQLPTTVLEEAKKDGDVTLGSVLPAFRALQKQIGGKSRMTVWVNYPYLLEAEVVALSDRYERYSLEKGAGKQAQYDFVSVDYTDEQKREFANISEKANDILLYGKSIPGTGGIEIDDGDVGIMVCVRPISTLTVSAQTGAQKQHFDSDEVWVPIQVVALENQHPDERFSACPPRPIKERFPENSNVMCLQSTGYGQVGKVIGYETNPSKKTVDLNVLFDAKTPQIPPFGHTIANSIVDQYVSTKIAAKHLGISTLTLGKIAGSVYIRPGRFDIGLNLKVGREFKLNGYTRSKVVDQQKVAWKGNDSVKHISGLDPEDDENVSAASSFGGSMMWEYSSRAIELIAAYRAKFPQVFKVIEEHGDTIEYEKDEMFPKVANGKLSLFDKCAKWLEQLDTHHLPLLPVSSKSISRDAIAAVQRASDDVRAHIERQKAAATATTINENNKYVTVKLSPSVVLSNDDVKSGQWINSPTANVNPKLGDRVANMTNVVAPFGLRGTIVAIHPSTGYVEVLFDSFFVGGTTLYGACAGGRGLLLAYSQLLNLSSRSPIKPRAVYEVKEKKTVKKAKNQPKELKTKPVKTPLEVKLRESKVPINEVADEDTEEDDEEQILLEKTFDDTDDLAKFWLELQRDNKRSKGTKENQVRKQKQNKKIPAKNIVNSIDVSVKQERQERDFVESTQMQVQNQTKSNPISAPVVAEETEEEKLSKLFARATEIERKIKTRALPVISKPNFI